MFVADWEESEAGGLCLSDVFRFIYQQASVLGPWPGAMRLTEEFRESGALLRAKASYPNSHYFGALLTLMLQEYLRQPTALLQDLLGLTVTLFSQ